jgi:DNA primase
MNTLSTGRDLDDPKTKSQIAGQIMPLIRDIPDSVERDAYRQQLAHLLHVDDRALLPLSSPTQGTSIFKKRSPRGAEKPEIAILTENSTREKIIALEKYCLQLLLNHPEDLYKINRLLKLAGLENFSEQDFEDAKNQQLAKLLIGSLNQDVNEPIQYIKENHIAALDDLLAELKPIDEKEKSDHARHLDPFKKIEEIMRALLKLRHTHILIEIEQLRSMVEDALKGTETETNLYQNQIMGHIKTRGMLDRALANPLQITKSPNV